MSLDTYGRTNIQGVDSHRRHVGLDPAHAQAVPAHHFLPASDFWWRQAISLADVVPVCCQAHLWVRTISAVVATTWTIGKQQCHDQLQTAYSHPHWSAREKLERKIEITILVHPCNIEVGEHNTNCVYHFELYINVLTVRIWTVLTPTLVHGRQVPTQGQSVDGTHVTENLLHCHGVVGADRWCTVTPRMVCTVCQTAGAVPEFLQTRQCVRSCSVTFAAAYKNTHFNAQPL